MESTLKLQKLKPVDENWYPIKSDKYLKLGKYYISDYGRVKKEGSCILKPKIAINTNLSYYIRISNTGRYYNGFELMLENIPALKMKNHYLIKPVFSGQDILSIKDKVYGIWSKASTKDEWIYIQDLDLWISEKFDIYDPNKSKCIPIQYNRRYPAFVTPAGNYSKVCIILARLIYIVFVMKQTKKVIPKLQEDFRIRYIDGNPKNISPENLDIR